MARDSKRQSAPATLGFLTKGRQTPNEDRHSQADANDVAYAKHVLDDPETEWMDWDDAKRELADKGD